MDEREMFLRSWWFASRLALGTMLSCRARLELMSALGTDEENRQQLWLFELVAYSSACVLRQLRDDIEQKHGWNSESYELHIGYQACLGAALNQTFGLGSDANGCFHSLLGAYYLPEYGRDYDEFWGIAADASSRRAIGSSDASGSGAECPLCKPSDAEPYTIHRFYAFRVDTLYRVVNPVKVVERALAYRDFAISLYRPAYMEHALDDIEQDLADMYAQE